MGFAETGLGTGLRRRTLSRCRYIQGSLTAGYMRFAGDCKQAY